MIDLWWDLYFIFFLAVKQMCICQVDWALKVEAHDVLSRRVTWAKAEKVGTVTNSFSC